MDRTAEARVERRARMFRLRGASSSRARTMKPPLTSIPRSANAGRSPR